jgi:sugar O-acyltransferase (sialic acid O-acetyltransferase NeuD family)
MKRIIGLGAEPYAAVIIELIERAGLFEVSELLNDDDSITVRTVRGVSVGGTSEWIPKLMEREGMRDFFMGLSSIRAREKKRELFQYAIACGLTPWSFVHPRAIIAGSAGFGRGSCILAGAIISTQTRLAENVTVNIGAIIESDCIIQSHVQLGAGSCVGCGTQIDSGSYIGNGAYVQPRVHIGENAVIGPGAIIEHDIADGQEVPGPQQNPAGHPAPNTGRKTKFFGLAVGSPAPA